MIPPEDERAAVAQLLSHPLHFPDEFKRWLSDYVATNVPLIPYGHIFGARQNTGRSGVYISTSETKAATAYGDLATVGPEITEIANGSYLVIYGAKGREKTSLSVNEAEPSDDDSLWGEEASPSAARMKIVSLQSNNQNTLKLQYRNGTKSHRWLAIMRLGAPGES